MNVHFTDPYLLNPQHKITVHLIGCGGTGSQVLAGIARLNEALCSFGHPGLHLYAWDHDAVSEANVGRQLFSPADIGQNKAIVLVTRLNRFYGYNWEAFPYSFDNSVRANIIITCVDTAAARIAIAELIDKPLKGEPHRINRYWLDYGNAKKTGQCVLGTLYSIHQPKSEHNTFSTLPTVNKLFKLSAIKEEDQGPSCSLAEALNKQDLYINSTLAQLGLNLLWKLFREGMIVHHGCYLNLDTLITQPIKITANEKRLRAKQAGGCRRNDAKASKSLLQNQGSRRKERPADKKQTGRKQVR